MIVSTAAPPRLRPQPLPVHLSMIRTTTCLGPWLVRTVTSMHWPQMRPPCHCPALSPGMRPTSISAWYMTLVLPYKHAPPWLALVVNMVTLPMAPYAVSCGLEAGAALHAGAPHAGGNPDGTAS